MSKKTKPSAPSVGDPGEPPPRNPLEIANDETDQKIAELMRRADMSGATVNIKRRAVNETEFGYLGEMPFENYSEANIRTIYGGGDYKLQVRRARDQQFVTAFNLKVDYRIPSLYPGVPAPGAEKTDRTPEVIAAVTAAVQRSIPAPVAQDNSLLLEMIKQQGAQNAALLASLAAPKNDGALTMLTTALAEMRQEMREIKNTRQQQPRERDPLEQLQQMIQLQEMIADSRGGSEAPAEKPDWKMKLFEVLGPAFAPMLANMVQAQACGGAFPAPALTAAPVLPGGGLPERTVRPLEPEPAATPSPAPANSDPAMNPLVSVYLSKFRVLAVQAALRGRDPVQWIEDKLDEIPANFHDPIFHLAGGEDWFTKIFAGDPEAQKQFAWLLAMRNAVLTVAFVADVKASAITQPRPEPEAYAADFLTRSSVTFHDALFDMLSPETWGELFAASQVDAVWLEKVRAEFDRTLGGEAEPEKNVTPPDKKPKPARGRSVK